MELNELTRGPLGAALAGRHSLEVAGQPLDLGGETCPFVRKGSLSVRWDGQVSPCLALLHSHTSYLDQTERRVRAFSFGNLNDAGLAELWHGEDYRALRARLAAFDFSPCFTCNSCDLVESNQEECFGNTAPTCGGCLWAQGFIQCP
jgi:MoaA/NifB/PqqE/SkfB family radical SAM enzyme